MVVAPPSVSGRGLYEWQTAPGEVDLAPIPAWLLTRLLELWEKISRMEQRLQELDATREQIYKAQQQIQSNMQALGQSGKEGALRVRYVEQLEQTEGQLRAIESEETKIQADLDRTRQQIDQELKRLA